MTSVMGGRHGLIYPSVPGMQTGFDYLRWKRQVPDLLIFAVLKTVDHEDDIDQGNMVELKQTSEKSFTSRL